MAIELDSSQAQHKDVPNTLQHSSNQKNVTAADSIGQRLLQLQTCEIAVEKLWWS